MRDCESVKETLRVSDDDVRAAGDAVGGTVRCGEELSALLPSVLDRAFKGEL